MSFPKHYSLKKEHDKHFEIHDKRDGKSFTVAKKDLHPAHQIKIMKMQKLAEGGTVQGAPVFPTTSQTKDLLTGQHGQMDKLKSLLGFGEKKKYSGEDGDPNDQVVSGDTTPSYLKAPKNDLVPDYMNTPVKDLKFSQEQPDTSVWSKLGDTMNSIGNATYDQAVAPAVALGEKAMDIGSHMGMYPGVSMGQSMNSPEDEQPSGAAGAPTDNRVPSGNLGAPSATGLGSPGLGVNSSGAPTVGGLQGLERQQGAALQAEGDARAKQNDQVADLEQMANWSRENSAKVYNEKRQTLEQQNDNLAQEIAGGTIDPNRLWNTATTGSKVASILGVILGGIGAGLQHSTTNMAWEALQKNIDRDIQSQRDDLGKKQTLFSDNLRRLGSIDAAEAATRVQTNAIVQGNMAKIAAQTNNPILQAQIQQKIVEMKMKDIPLKDALAREQAQKASQQQLKTMLQGKDLSNMDPASLVPLIVPQHMQNEVLKEIKGAQDTRHSMSHGLAAYDDMVKELKGPLGGILDPKSKTNMMAALLPTVQHLEGTAREFAMKQAEQNYIPTKYDILRGTDKNKRKALEDYYASKSSAPTAKSFNIDLDKFESTNPEASGAPVERLTKDGKVGVFDSKTKQFLRYK